jgi:metal-responsive CopG/Arc/MetJ family transcriptional regulator
MDRVQVNILMPKGFVRFIDETAKLTGSTRSDLIRRAVEHYIAELKKANLLSDLKKVKADG